MRTRVWIGIVTVLVIVSGILGYVHHPYNAPQSTTPSYLSKQQIIADIQKQQLTQNKVAQDVRVMHLKTIGNEGVAFATFRVNGQQEFASLLMSSTGYDMSTYTMGTDKAVTIQYTTLGGDGFEYITGGVFDHPSVVSAVIIWSNGTAVTVPVQNGYFWYEHRVQMPTDPHVKQVVGITSRGTIVQSEISKSQ
ncbi:hypothetical protein NZD89_02145 [Alicyclobacillus fastidiosus]|uniref:Uncharacterized protein n=1 Tax=Alicyclobacillus fastidiosus TaxID=392011 RepID=A0ABY6ZHG8_9BACL|nr:hypothetical protein [Alicyclobacillus fastidiosus]WAH42330.1 hypothetical protein NZD89_02145 [Alicyclobacillus fastidiosus]GMA64138.1 hypothetical protein GCM10025859_45780 [Alicyclobacillus fastidiosus]